MGQFNAKGLTAKGQALQAKAQAGAQLNYTKFMIGDGNLGGSPIGPLTALISPKLTLPITGKEMTPPDRATLMTVVDNQGVTTGFYWREVGIFAQDPDEGEILYWYGNAGAMADYIPAGGGSDIFQEQFAVLVFVGEATNVTAVINSSLVYATQDDLTAAKEEMKDYTDTAVAGVTIPSASLTQQGKVQLNNAIDSTNQTMAATPKAVNDARQSAIISAATDATTKANAAETNSKNYVDSKAWQKFKLTEDNGRVINLPINYDLNNLITAGQYDCNSPLNGPLGNQAGPWFYIEVLVHSNGNSYVMQRATRLENTGPTLYVRVKLGNSWSAWSPDVFQSGVEAKQGIVNAINAKGGSASTNDSWAVLADKVRALDTKKPQVVTPSIALSTAQTEFFGLGSRYYPIATFPAGTGFIESFNLTVANNISSDNDFAIGSGNQFVDTEVRIVLIDKNDTEWTVCVNNSAYGSFPVDFLSIYIDRGVAFWRNQFVNTPVVTMNMPSNFDRTGDYRLSFRQINKGGGWSHAYLYFKNTAIYSF
ncbi:tail fiber protein [Paenibacillus hubeiensis]|uniref:tail fiber protein n=1 Tax=Paenibacillus hubeiensis TaxID=3077330 RepID=UPI0031BA41CA